MRSSSFDSICYFFLIFSGFFFSRGFNRCIVVYCVSCAGRSLFCIVWSLFEIQFKFQVRCSYRNKYAGQLLFVGDLEYTYIWFIINGSIIILNFLMLLFGLREYWRPAKVISRFGFTHRCIVVCFCCVFLGFFFDFFSFL